MNEEIKHAIDELKKDLSLVKEKLNRKERELKECADEYREMCSYQIAQLRAVQMLFDTMASGSTHRQKELFASIARDTMNREIENIKNKYSSSIWKFGQSEDSLPF